jgi:hypothetical protein
MYGVVEDRSSPRNTRAFRLRLPIVRTASLPLGVPELDACEPPFSDLY